MLNRRKFNKLLGAGLMAGLSFQAQGKGHSPKPNVLYIFADQMRFSAMSCMAGVPGAGQEPKALHTPNLDRVVQEGMLFTHAFSTTPVCSPYRVGIQTGQYCNKVGYSLDPKEPSIAHVLKAQGYSATAEQLAKYYGQVESLDEQMGRILKTLADSGLAENTILCFSSDHGDTHFSHKHQDAPTAGGYKRRPYEEAARIPFIMRWPLRIKPGQKRDMLFGSVNVMPTLLGLCAAPIPKTVQGENLSTAILENQPGPDSVFLQQTAPGNTAFRSPWRAIRTHQYLYATSGHTGNGGWLLYDMDKDPYQLKNCIHDPAYAAIRCD
jgi:arylsulfatase A-like enzyme